MTSAQRKAINGYQKAGTLTNYDSPLYIMNRAVMKMIRLVETIRDSKDLSLTKKSIHELNLITRYFKEFEESNINPGVALNFVIFHNIQKDILNGDYNSCIRRLQSLAKVLNKS